MSPFEYLAVLVSLILGLGITHLLSGVGHTIHRRGRQLFLASYVLGIGLLWSLSARSQLEG